MEPIAILFIWLTTLFFLFRSHIFLLLQQVSIVKFFIFHMVIVLIFFNLWLSTLGHFLAFSTALMIQFLLILDRLTYIRKHFFWVFVFINFTVLLRLMLLFYLFIFLRQSSYFLALPLIIFFWSRLQIFKIMNKLLWLYRRLFATLFDGQTLQADPTFIGRAVLLVICFRLHRKVVSLWIERMQAFVVTMVLGNRFNLFHLKSII